MSLLQCISHIEIFIFNYTNTYVLLQCLSHIEIFTFNLLCNLSHQRPQGCGLHWDSRYDKTWGAFQVSIYFINSCFVFLINASKPMCLPAIGAFLFENVFIFTGTKSIYIANCKPLSFSAVLASF